MTDPFFFAAELKTRFWVDALRRRAEAAGAHATLARRGDPDAGAVLVKVRDRAGGAWVYAGARDLDGARSWFSALGDAARPEVEAERYIARRLEDDPDLWVVEIEDGRGRAFLTEPVEKS